MGNPEVHEIEISATDTAVDVTTYPCMVGVRKVSSVRCVIVLLFTIGVLISTIFWIAPITGFGSGFVPDDAHVTSGVSPI
ncbi:hypothetical protein KFK09_025007 [Dendrobium nobile]|uniref:Uncharacterized protein n=1 Tax=Dendrobium nobile TaxID=94219 RepID=A0A8T3AFN1_DENNO|nr:hypothetical protein KFK09_025007 [Dendrobium nobile]